jgi:hypothetical protein
MSLDLGRSGILPVLTRLFHHHWIPHGKLASRNVAVFLSGKLVIYNVVLSQGAGASLNNWGTGLMIPSGLLENLSNAVGIQTNK